MWCRYAPCRVEKHSQAALHELLESYVEGLEKTLLSKAKDLRARRRHDQNTLLLRGELSEERQERCVHLSEVIADGNDLMSCFFLKGKLLSTP